MTAPLPRAMDPRTVYTDTHRPVVVPHVDVIDGSLLARRDDCPRPTALGVLVDGFRARSWQRLALIAALIIGGILFVPLCLSLAPDARTAPPANASANPGHSTSVEMGRQTKDFAR